MKVLGSATHESGVYALWSLHGSYPSESLSEVVWGILDRTASPKNPIAAYQLDGCLFYVLLETMCLSEATSNIHTHKSQEGPKKPPQARGPIVQSGCGSILNYKTADFSLCFHLPGFHFRYLFFTQRLETNDAPRGPAALVGGREVEVPEFVVCGSALERPLDFHVLKVSYFVDFPRLALKEICHYLLFLFLFRFSFEKYVFIVLSFFPGV